MARILLVDDDQTAQFSFSRFLHNAGHEVEVCGSLQGARRAIADIRFDVLLLDLKLPDGNGLEWIPRLRRQCPEMFVVVISATDEVDTAVRAMREGADNFLTKPVDLQNLEIYLRKGLELEGLRRNQRVRERLEKPDPPYFPDHPKTRKVVDLARIGAASDHPVLLTGETGTGKGMMARWIHANSTLAAKPFVEVNCAVLRGDLLASELFGHAKGAFTSAHEEKTGLVEISDGGTLFLDEIGEMNTDLQVQLLKILEEKKFRRVGDLAVRKSEFRLICATNRALEEQVAQGGFRQDLYYRINLFPLAMPALRTIRECIPEYISHFMSLNAEQIEMDPEIPARLSEYDWPGNIRELKNMVERAVLLAQGGKVFYKHFKGIGDNNDTGDTAEAAVSLEAVEKRHISTVLKACRGNVQKAVTILGISRATMYRKMSKYGL